MLSRSMSSIWSNHELYCTRRSTGSRNVIDIGEEIRTYDLGLRAARRAEHGFPRGIFGLAAGKVIKGLPAVIAHMCVAILNIVVRGRETRCP